jgi:dienelactone hydrolase
MKTYRLVGSLGRVAIFFTAALVGVAQMQPEARYKGELLPVVDCSDVYLYVLKDGHKKQTGYEDYTIQPAAAFGAGFVEIQKVEVDLDPLRNASASDRAKPDSLNFRYEADLSSDRDLGQCYALLTFVAKGSVGTWFVPIGRLHKAVPKHVKVAFRDRVDVVGSLHVFSEGAEIQSTQIRKSYNVREYYASLIRGSPEPSALELLKTDYVYPHVLSNDGRRLATIRDRDTHYSLVVYDLNAKKLLCDVTVGKFEDEVSDLTWVSDHELAYVSKRELRYQYFWATYMYRELMLLDVDSGKTEKLEDEVDDIIMSLRKQPEVLVLSQSRYGPGTWFIKFNVRTRRDSDLEQPDGGFFMFDDLGNSRLHYLYEGAKAEFEFRPTPGSSWKRLDARVKTPGLKFDLPAQNILDRVADIHSVGPDGDILYISSRLNSDVFQLAAFSMSEGVVKRTIAAHPTYDLTNGDFGMARLLFRKGSSEIIGMIYEAEKPGVIWLDPGFKAVQEAMDKTFADHVNLPIDWAEDGSTFIFFSTSDRDPGTYYVFRPLQSTLMPLLVLGDRLKGKKMARTESHDFAARDGALIHAYVTYPPDPSPGPLPLVVDIHGGPMVRDVWGFDAETQFLATRGYVVLQVNYRGSSGYGAKYQSAGLRARLDTVVIDDIADGVRHLLKEGKVDPSRVGVIGASFGGWATYMSLIRYPDLYRTGVAISAISHWRNFLKKDRWRPDRHVSYAFWRSLLERQNFSTDEPLIDPYLRAGELKQPIDIMHGQYDGVVDVDEAKMMIKTLQKTNAQVESILFPYAGHTYDEWGFFDKVRRLNEIGDFLDRHLKTASIAVPASSGPAPGPTPGPAGR